MKVVKNVSFCILIIFVCLFICIGYASVSNNLTIDGTASVTPAFPDVYITDITPNSSAGVTVNSTDGTVMFAEVNGRGTATFTIDVINISNTVYVFDRVIDGIEVGIDGVYSGTDITYTLSGITRLDEIEELGGTLSFDITINVPSGVTAENYVLKFNFIKKTGTEVLPGNDEYNITFQYNNGDPNKTIVVHGNEFIPHPETPQRPGYTFTGWYTDTTYTTAWNFDVDRASKDMTLYAGWEVSAITEYSVTFRPNNGDPTQIIFVPAGSLIPPTTSPTMEGYSFIGWYTDSACTTAWNLDTDKVNSNLILYGGWEIYVPPVPPDCNITFKPNNGEPDTTIIVLTGNFIPRPTQPVRSGYTFTGWYIDEACTTAWNFEVDKVDSHTVLWGGWEIENIVETIEYTITFKPNNGGSDSTVTVESGNHIPRPTLPTREGYTFIGWYTDEECTLGWNFDTDYPTSNMTLYGGWEKNSSQDQEYHSDFMGLVEALLSKNEDCLNANNLIFNAVMESYDSKKRPKEDAPILHCNVNSVSGGTISAIATYANSNLTKNLHFIFEADPDPVHRSTRLRLYMYYGSDIESAAEGDEIMVYQQILTRNSDGIWHADGTYIGTATVGNYFGGGKSGNDVKTISPYTFKTGSTVAE